MGHVETEVLRPLPARPAACAAQPRAGERCGAWCPCRAGCGAERAGGKAEGVEAEGWSLHRARGSVHGLG